MNELELYQEKIFEEIKHIDEFGYEFWYARDLAVVLKYTEWRKFLNVINKAIIACDNSKSDSNYHFGGVAKMVDIGSKTKRKVSDYKLTRYACYLIVQNADSRKKEVALGQTYFAIQTRKMEILESDYDNLSEDEKRLITRNKTKKFNLTLNKTARDAGVKNFDKFTNAGYKGLYNGETADDIAKRKELRYREDILDNMGEEELVANLFRISLTNQKIKNEHITGEINASNAHYDVGSLVRKTIIDAGGTVPEKLPTPSKSIKEIEKESLKKIKGGSYSLHKWVIV